MITIKEIVPIKLSGLSSLLVKFPFNQEIINYLKSLDLAVYHKSLTAWELPIYYLAALLDNLVFYDDIDLQLLDSGVNPETKELTSNINYQHNVESVPECIQEAHDLSKIKESETITSEIDKFPKCVLNFLDIICFKE